MGIREPDLTEVVKYLNPVMAAMGCGLGADVISAYSAYNFLQPGVNGYYRYQNGGADPTDTLYVAMHVINVAVRNWRFLERLGIASARWFEGFRWWVSLRRNLEIPGQLTQPLDPSKPTVLTMYNPFPLPGQRAAQQILEAARDM
jgi:hypothetical protein